MDKYSAEKTYVDIREKYEKHHHMSYIGNTSPTSESSYRPNDYRLADTYRSSASTEGFRSPTTTVLTHTGAHTGGRIDNVPLSHSGLSHHPMAMQVGLAPGLSQASPYHRDHDMKSYLPQHNGSGHPLSHPHPQWIGLSHGGEWPTMQPSIHPSEIKHTQGDMHAYQHQHMGHHTAWHSPATSTHMSTTASPPIPYTAAGYSINGMIPHGGRSFPLVGEDSGGLPSPGGSHQEEIDEETPTSDDLEAFAKQFKVS